MNEKEAKVYSNDELLNLFLNTKRIEGCSKRTTGYYSEIIQRVLFKINKSVVEVEAEDIRAYLVEYQEENNVSEVTLDNVRRVLSSFFNWLEDEGHILKSPMKRIHKIKSRKKVKKAITEEELVMIRDGLDNSRDKALIDFLVSTGVRVGELINLDIDDVDLLNRECVVYGKGNKERIVYFNAQAKIHLEEYLKSRTDNNPALFVTKRKPYSRLKINSVERLIRDIGKNLGIELHPHKFRRTAATMAIDKGMPIEQVKELLGHEKIDTTMAYAMVKQQNVKFSHSKYMG